MVWIIWIACYADIVTISKSKKIRFKIGEELVSARPPSLEV